MIRREFLKKSSLGLLALGLPTFSCRESNRKRPNIIWIVTEDMSCHFGYNGEKAVKTPNVDKLAAEGAVFTNAYVTCPVCSPSRSAMITGMYQTTIGAHNHRSSSTPESAIHLPEGVKTIPELFKAAGYFTCNSGNDLKWDKPGKTDYNFVYENSQLYDGTDWTNRKPNQPFFAQIQLTGGKGRNANFKADVDTSKIKLPPYYPNDPVIVDDWKDYLKTVIKTDYEVGKIIERLKQENLFDNTIIFFITDHGISHARGKQFLYDEGTKIPFIIWGPKYIEQGVREELIAHIDMAATSLYFAGIEIPEYMESRTLYGPKAEQRDFVISARDRCDETEDRIRSVRKGDFKYIRNYHPKRPYLQPCVYKDYKPILKRMRKLYAENKLNQEQSLIMAETRPEEELYDLSNDPFELRNLATEPVYKEKLEELRSILNKWIVETDDKGQYQESWENYSKNMEAANASLLSRGGKNQKKAEDRVLNISLMKKWREAGI
ncbi:MAG: sulfatase [bacterium]|nr:MAG: sulfatase [bacterium]